MNWANLRAAVAKLVGLSAGLPIALISITKLVLFLSALFEMARGWRRGERVAALAELWSPRIILASVLMFGLSLYWTIADSAVALGAVGKYGKLLIIPCMLIVMRERRHANQVMLIFLAAQVFLCLSAWLLYFHVRLPWATSNMAQEKFAVFSSYLDQGIMSAVAAAVLWHLRTLAPSPVVHRLMVALSVVALGNVFLVFSGRTGHLVGIAMISLAIFWQLPKRFRLAAFVIPPVLFIAALAGFGKVGEGFEKARQEMSAYSGTPTAGSSVGMRLSFWKASVESIAAHPAFGTGVGSWLVQYEKFAPPRSDKERHGNPHQEFLLWGVQLGVGGIALLLVLLASLCRDFTRLESASARAGLSAVAALAISCLFNSTLYDAYIGDFFCITFAVLLGYGWLSRQTVVPAETTVSAKSA